MYVKGHRRKYASITIAIGKGQSASAYIQFSSKPVGLASCLWLARTVPYFVMASGHELTFNAIVMNIVNIASSIMAIDPGTRMARFLPLSLER